MCGYRTVMRMTPEERVHAAAQEVLILAGGAGLVTALHAEGLPLAPSMVLAALIGGFGYIALAVLWPRRMVQNDTRVGHTGTLLVPRDVQRPGGTGAGDAPDAGLLGSAGQAED